MVYRKVDEKVLETMKKLRKAGLSYIKIGKKLNLSNNTVQYHLNKEYKEKVIQRVKNWQKRNRERIKKRNRLWRKLNPKIYRRSVCLSLVRNYLKQKIISIDDLKSIIKEVKGKAYA